MNLMILEQKDFIADDMIELSGRRLKHMLEIQKVVVGSSIKAGLINGKVGTAIVTDIRSKTIILQVRLTEQPPAPLPKTLIIALPRPKMLRRIIQTVATLGIKDLYLINTWKVEKSYWLTPKLCETNIREQLILGLEQGCDTILPKVILKKCFKPFLEDELTAIVKDSSALVAHPNKNKSDGIKTKKNIVLAVGPEGGFTEYEVKKFIEIGFQPISLGQRIQRVETVVPFLLGKLS